MASGVAYREAILQAIKEESGIEATNLTPQDTIEYFEDIGISEKRFNVHSEHNGLYLKNYTYKIDGQEYDSATAMLVYHNEVIAYTNEYDHQDYEEMNGAFAGIETFMKLKGF
jgi:hypothetical protein